MKRKTNGISRLRIAIPPQMPTQIPQLTLGMPALPFTMTKPFAQIKQYPEGGAYATTANIRRASVGGVSVTTTKESPNSNRRTRRSPSGNSSKANKSKKGTQTQKSKAGDNAKLLKKKPRLTINRLKKSVKRAASKFTRGIVGRGLKRDSNGKFIPKGG